MADPILAEPADEVASIALATDLATIREVQALVDAEHGFPRYIRHTQASQYPRARRRCVTPLPRAELPAALATKIEKKTAKEIDRSGSTRRTLRT